MTFVRYLLLSLVVLLFQATLAPLFSIRDIQPDLAILLVIAIALREGRFWGTVAGFLLGVGVDATTTQFFGLSALTGSVGGYIAGSFDIEPAELNFRRWMQIVGIAVLSERLLYYAVFSLSVGPSTFWNWWRFAIPSALYTLALAAIVAAVWPKGFFRSRAAKL